MKTYTVMVAYPSGLCYEGLTFDTEREAQTEVYNLQIEFPDKEYWYEVEGKTNELVDL